MIITTGRLSFDSGYTTKVSTDRPSCLTVTHSLCRGDFASAALAQSCAEAVCANAKITKAKIMRFIYSPLRFDLVDISHPRCPKRLHHIRSPQASSIPSRVHILSEHQVTNKRRLRNGALRGVNPISAAFGH